MTTTTVNHFMIDILACNIKKLRTLNRRLLKTDTYIIWWNSNVAHHILVTAQINMIYLPISLTDVTAAIDCRCSISTRLSTTPIFKESISTRSNHRGIRFLYIPCAWFFFYFKWFYDLKQKPAKQKTIIYLKSYIWNTQVW